MHHPSAHATHAEFRRHGERSHAAKVREHRAHGGHVGHENAADRRADEAMVKKAVREHEEHDHKGEKPTKLKLKHGGRVAGEHSGHRRLDRKGHAHGGRVAEEREGHARGGKAKGKAGNHVNVVVAVPHKDPMAAGPGPMMAPHPMAPPPVAHPPMGPGGPPMAPPGAMAGGPPGVPPRPPIAAGVPGMMPRKSGGRAFKRGGAVKRAPDADGDFDGPPVERKEGGRVKRDLGGGLGGNLPFGGQYAGQAGQFAQNHPIMADRFAQNHPMATQAIMNNRPPATPMVGAAPAVGTPPMKRGGAAKRAEGGRIPHMTAGAESGEGRLEKIKAYGKASEKGEARV